MKGQLWVDLVGELIVARVRGEPNAELLRECHEKVLALVKDTGRKEILYDALEMDTPPVEVPLVQWKLDEELGVNDLKRAIVVPNSRLAYLARLSFGEGDHHVFYNDIVAAIEWLKPGAHPPG